MSALAHTWHDGPGPWLLLFPLAWAAALVGACWLLRRTVWRGRPRPLPADVSPVALLGRRFAAGEIDEEEYRRRRTVLTEDWRGQPPGGGAPAAT